MTHLWKVRIWKDPQHPLDYILNPNPFWCGNSPPRGSRTPRNSSALRLISIVFVTVIAISSAVHPSTHPDDTQYCPLKSWQQQPHCAPGAMTRSLAPTPAFLSREGCICTLKKKKSRAEDGTKLVPSTDKFAPETLCQPANELSWTLCSVTSNFAAWWDLSSVDSLTLGSESQAGLLLTPIIVLSILH